MPDVHPTQTTPVLQIAYWKSRAAFEMVAKLEREDENMTFYIGTSHEVNPRQPAMFLMAYCDKMKRDVDLYEFETKRSRRLAAIIMKRLNLEVHRFDGRNFNVLVQRVRLGDLLPLLPTAANVRRTKIMLLVS